jgi:hypothetical protein
MQAISPRETPSPQKPIVYRKMGASKDASLAGPERHRSHVLVSAKTHDQPKHIVQWIATSLIPIIRADSSY